MSGNRSVRDRILLSVPHMSGLEAQYVQEAFETNWLSTVGPNLPAFELEMEQRLGVAGVALASGTAAIHLGLRLLGVGPGDQVYCPTLTFAASANPIRYLGAEPVFIDSERSSWNMDPKLLAHTLQRDAARNRLPKAIVVVHLFGQCADMDPIRELARQYRIGILEDAAEALGATYRGRAAGTLGDVAAFSFNGNKIITTTGGGMLVSGNREWVEKARYWATQARDQGIAFEHSELGYNYRLSNVLAGIGRGQLKVLDLRVAQRREIAKRYEAGFAKLGGFSPMPEASYGISTKWLSCFLVEEERFGLSRDQLISYLDSRLIESRPVWKPMHLQALYRDCRKVGGQVAEDLFRRGICLPSSSSLSAFDQGEVIKAILSAAGQAAARTYDECVA